MPVPHSGPESEFASCIIGSTGLIGSKVVAVLSARGHSVVAATRAFGVNTLTREEFDAVREDASAHVVLSVVGTERLPESGYRIVSLVVNSPLNATLEIAGPERFRAG